MKTRTYRAAGGVVQDAQGRVLLITRNVTRSDTPALEVRLPKGHVEPGESDEQAARREVCEETGYCDLAVAADLGTNSVEFVLHDEQVMRTEHYFLMRLTNAQRGEPHFDSPGAEEARFQPLWAEDLADAEQALTFDSERLMVRRAKTLANSDPPR